MYKLQNNINTMINGFFAQFKVLVGKPVYKTLSNKVVLQIPYFVPKLSNGNTLNSLLTENKLSALGSAITQQFKSTEGFHCKVEIRFIRLGYPYLNCAILAQYIAMNGNKYSFTRLQKGLFNKVPTICMSSALPADALPSLLIGIKIELAGRLVTQRGNPRKTVNNSHIGSFLVSRFRTKSGMMVDSSLDFSQYASKNKLGAYTMKI